MVDNIQVSINRLLENWIKQGFGIFPATIEKIEKTQREKEVFLPEDFVKLYTVVNGMRTHYPDDMDEEGFFFYSVEQLIPCAGELKVPLTTELDDVLIFAEYMHKSWWYGFKAQNGRNAYTIGLILDKDSFKPITDSLSEFIQFYLEDSPRLYPQ
ncbi:SMI1/KNR4 family protein [Mucilaginibacter sp. 22184]|uniref:SMI1/KNR4 family protein n=1 Tax=Mucilaginibacter sp. 22184 TaxID=3453887 RepID=UPI003F85C3B7